jgi:hypothetical protein
MGQWLQLALAAEAVSLNGLFRSDRYRAIVRGDPAGRPMRGRSSPALATRTERLSGRFLAAVSEPQGLTPSKTTWTSGGGT